MGAALSHIRVCDFTGQLAGAGATKWLASFGAEVIRIEHPGSHGQSDTLRGAPPFKDDRHGIEFGAAFNNYNVEKLGITVDAQTVEGRDLVAELVAISDVVTDNFEAGVLEGLGFGYRQLCQIRPEIVYVSNSGFGRTGPYRNFASSGPVTQALSGVTHGSGLAGHPPAGWGYSYLDHTGAYYMAMAILMALWHRDRTGEGQWVDLATAEAGANLHGADLLDWSVNDQPARRPENPDSNHNSEPPMAPHGVYRCQGEDSWVAIACRDDHDWLTLKTVIRSDWDQTKDPKRHKLDSRFDRLEGRLDYRSELETMVSDWCQPRSRWGIADQLGSVGVPVSVAQSPGERIDGDAATGSRGLWPMVTHPAMGGVRVDGQPVQLSRTPWSIEHAAPTLGQHNSYVFGELLGRTDEEIERLEDKGII